MSEILKTEAVILKKIDYGDTSEIITLFSKDFGKFSCILKGAKSPKSKMGAKVDLLNYLEIVFYKKAGRELQMISQVELLQHFSHIKEDLEKLKYASSILELINDIIFHDEPNDRLFRGTIKILNLINDSRGKEDLLFIKYFLFFLAEIGYETNFNACAVCYNKIDLGERLKFNFNKGLICSKCSENEIQLTNFSKELFNLTLCLNKVNIEDCDNKLSEKLIYLLIEYLKSHITEFKGLKSLSVF